MRRAFELLRLLADGEEHAGAAIAEQLGVTRAAVWNQVERLRDEGVDIAASSANGYQLVGGFEFLDSQLISGGLRAERDFAGLTVETLDVTTSTNQLLLDASNKEDIHQRIVFADYQTAGRGRRGDRWMSPPGSGLCFSVGWRFDTPPATFSALSLVVGVAMVEALRGLAIDGLALKWPNDVVRNGKKLAGILIEMRSEAGGPSVVVIGIGLNIRMSAAAKSMIDRPADDLDSAAGQRLSRNVVAGRLVNELLRTLLDFADSGFDPYRERWLGLDALADRTVTIEIGTRSVTGVARGVDEHGAFLIEHDGTCEKFLAGHLRDF